MNIKFKSKTASQDLQHLLVAKNTSTGFAGFLVSIKWFNNHQKHPSLDYLTRKDYCIPVLKKLSKIALRIQCKAKSADIPKGTASIFAKQAAGSFDFFAKNL